MNASRIWTLAALFFLLVAVSPSPVLAQSPSTCQYVDPSTGEVVGGCNAQSSVYEGVEEIGENAGQGTDAVNDAMKDPPATAADAPAASGSVLPAETAPPEAGRTEANSENQGLASITELPETGGAPLLVLCAGVALVGCGLLVRRIAL